jgi:RimJ/RimL family protein N-acetyltransferase
MISNEKRVFIETSRLMIYEPSLDDLEHQFILQSHPDVMQFIGKGPRTREEVRDGLEKAVQHFEKFQFSLGSVFEKSSQKFVGRAGLIHLAYHFEAPEIEVGYALLPEFWRKGYATELAKALIDWGFAHLNVNELVAVTRHQNTGSRKVLENAGMLFTHETIYNDIPVVFYSIKK